MICVTCRCDCLAPTPGCCCTTGSGCAFCRCFVSVRSPEAVLCPYCGTKAACEKVDIGVGSQQVAPYECPNCGASEISAERRKDDNLRLSDLEVKTGWYAPPRSIGNVLKADPDAIRGIVLCALCRGTLEPWGGPFHPWCKSIMTVVKQLIGEPPKHEIACDRCKKNPIAEWVFMVRKGEVFRVCMDCASEILVFHESVRKTNLQPKKETPS